jgi:urea transporter
MGVGYFDAKLVIDNYDWVQFSRLLVPTICISVFCSLTHFMLCTMKSPPFTFAYNITLSVWLAFAISLGPQSIYSTNIQPYSVTPVEYDSIDFGWFINAVLSGIGQVFFAPDFVSSLIILGGVCLASPLIALFAFSGSFIATGIAVITHSAKTGIEFGLDGYSSVLAAIALGGYYFVPSRGSFLYLIVGSVFCVPMRRVFQSLFIHPFGPALTFPFCLVASIMYLASLSTKWPPLVDKQFLSFPERHLIPSPTVNKNDSHTNLELINSA